MTRLPQAKVAVHEMSIAQAIVETVETEIERRPGSRLRKVGLRVGELAGVDSESLRFCLECLTKGTPYEGAAVDIQFCPRQLHCHDCGVTAAVHDFSWTCPECGSSSTEPAGGDELQVSYLELEEQ